MKVETKADGTGTVVPAQNVISGGAVTGYAISRDASGNFVANVAATWSLAGPTGGVVSGDLVPAVGNTERDVHRASARHGGDARGGDRADFD